MKMTSRFALVAAAGLLVGATVAPAKAADLGGGCCADLEERVAELEATTARKGNRVVSLQVYGQVNKALLIFDNDDKSDTFVVDNDFSQSRFGFQGSASIKPGWTAGYNMEIGLIDANSNSVTEGNDEGDNPLTLKIRVNEMYVDSEQFGRVTIGQGSSASDGITNIVLGNSYSDSEVGAGGGLGLGAFTAGELASDLSGLGRIDRVRYDTPSIYGFILSASWGENDAYDVALRFKKEWNSIRIAAGIAYAVQDDAGDGDTFEEVGGSISVMHVPTGLYMAFAAAERDVDFTNADPNYWYAQVGMEKRFFSAGSTTIYGEYGQYSDFVIKGDTTDRWGFGAVQAIDSAAMDIYANATFWSTDSTVPGDAGDLTTVMIGSRIKF